MVLNIEKRGLSRIATSQLSLIPKLIRPRQLRKLGTVSFTFSYLELKEEIPPFELQPLEGGSFSRINESQIASGPQFDSHNSSERGEISSVLISDDEDAFDDTFLFVKAKSPQKKINRAASHTNLSTLKETLGSHNFSRLDSLNGFNKNAPFSKEEPDSADRFKMRSSKLLSGTEYPAFSSKLKPDFKEKNSPILAKNDISPANDSTVKVGRSILSILKTRKSLLTEKRC